MPKFSAKQRKMRGQGKHHGPPFFQFPWHVQRSTSYHGLSLVARALLFEIGRRYTGSNNGFIVLGVREAAYELRCGRTTVCRAMRELDDADLARPTQIGLWRGRQATEWRITWKLCNKTQQLPRNQWQERKPYEQLLLPKPKKEALTNAERQRRWRDRQRNGNRNDECRYGNAEVPPQELRRYASTSTGPQNGNSSITLRNPSTATGPHLDIYQAQGDVTEAADLREGRLWATR